MCNPCMAATLSIISPLQKEVPSGQKEKPRVKDLSHQKRPLSPRRRLSLYQQVAYRYMAEDTLQRKSEY